MQKRSSGLRREYFPITYQEEFPIHYFTYEQGDKEINRLHVHNGLEVGRCERGSGIFVVEDKVFAFSAGDISLINDREMHLARSTSGTVSSWIYLLFDPGMLLGPYVDDPAILGIAELGGSEFANVFPGSRYPRLDALLTEMIRELDEKQALYQSAFRSKSWNLMLELHRLPGKDTAPEEAKDRTERIAPALEYVAAHYAEDIPIDFLAGLCGFSEVQFRRVFASAIGRSPKQYVTAVRMRIAASLCRTTDLAVLDISLQTGFSTLSNFNRCFRDTYGCSPREYRNCCGS